MPKNEFFDPEFEEQQRPPYVYQEFPRWMVKEGAANKLVSSAEEKAAAKAEGYAVIPDPHDTDEDDPDRVPVKRGPGRPRKDEA